MENLGLAQIIGAYVQGNPSTSVSAINQRGIEQLKKNGLVPSQNAFCLPVQERSAITVGGTGGEAIGSVGLSIMEPLRNNLVMGEAGATILTGLSLNVNMPTYSGSNVKWAGETEESEDGAGTFGNLPLKPKRITSKLILSKQVLLQTSNSVDEYLVQEISKALAEKIEITAFGAHASTDNIPDGMFTKMPLSGGNLSYSSLVELESTVIANNTSLGNLAYILHPSLVKKARLTEKAAGLDFILEGSKLNDYPVLFTNSMPSQLQVGGDEFGAVFGNWKDLVIGQFGAIEFVYDKFTKAAEGEVVLIVNAYVDIKMKRESSFAIVTMK